MPIAAVLQMTSTASVAENLATARTLLEQAHAAGAQLAVLPENFGFGNVGKCTSVNGTYA